MNLQRLLDLFEVIGVHLRSKLLAAAQAVRLRSSFAKVLIELHADLSGTLENMKELSKRQIEKGKYHRYRMQHRQKTVVQSMQQVSGCRQEESRNGNGKQQQQGHHVLRELLHRNRPAIARPAEQREGYACQHHDGGDVQNIEAESCH